MGTCIPSLAQNTHLLFPCLRLGVAVIFPKVSSRGLCARLSGELWRGWRRLACWMKKPVTCAFCGTATSHSYSPPATPPPTPFSWGGLPAETGRLILPCSYPSDKALCSACSSRLLSLFLKKKKKKRYKPFFFFYLFMLSPVWCLRLSSGLPASGQDSWVTAIWGVNSIPPRVVQGRSQRQV